MNFALSGIMDFRHRCTSINDEVVHGILFGHSYFAQGHRLIDRAVIAEYHFTSPATFTRPDPPAPPQPKKCIRHH